jgi:hypothetical protein
MAYAMPFWASEDGQLIGTHTNSERCGMPEKEICGPNLKNKLIKQEEFCILQ